MAPEKYRTTPFVTDKMPPGIPYIVGNEAAERFSFYGMKTILQAYMTLYLLDAFGRKAVMQPEQAQEWQFYFGFAAYFFPLLGALVSDVFLGKYRTILFVSWFYCVGHLILALNDFHWVHQKIGLAVGLVVIAIGAGGIKPCVSAHVGDQFGKKNENLLARAFFWFYFAINFGSFISTLLTPWLLKHKETFGPKWAFGVPGVLMLVATIVFWMGRHKFVHVPPGGLGFLRETFSREGLRAVARLIPLYLFMIIFWSVYENNSVSWVNQAMRLDRVLPLVHWELLASQVQAVNPILVLIFIPLFSMAVYPLIDRYLFRLTPLRKVSIGFFALVLSFVVVSWTEQQLTGGQVVSTTSDFEPEEWAAHLLLDGKSGGIGWASDERKQEGTDKPAPPPFPQEIVIALRENRAWEIDKVRIDVSTVQYRLEEGEAKSVDAPSARRNWAKDVLVSVGPSPKNGPWTKVGQTTLRPAPGPQTISFSPVTTKYVQLSILSNYGGNAVTLSEIEVLATAASPPADAHEQATRVWPNVAALGDRPNVIWQLLAFFILTAAEVIVYATCLEFSYTQAPRKMKSFVMGLFLLSASLGNLLDAVINGVIQNADGTSKLPGANYFWFFTAIMLVASLLFIPYARFYKGKTYLQE
ncbi:MAG: hypothetical protein HYS13_21975 [Planctomycetia bacterium]|nr:hypothetical protein [Planctomycetia bacterium]